MKKVISLFVFSLLLLTFSVAQQDSINQLQDSSIVDSINDSFVEIIQAPLKSVKDDTTKKDSLQETKQAEVVQPKVIIENKIDPPKPKQEEEVLPDLKEIISVNKIIWSIILLVITYFIIKLLVLIVYRLAEKSTNHRITLKSIAPFIRIIGWTFVIFVIIHGVFRPPMQTLIAVVASAGIAVGFAAQDILKNIFGGIMILFDRPFQVGDKIAVGDHYGEVKEIGLRSTRIQTKDDSLVSVPNAEVMNTAVSNSNSGEANCQVVAEIYLPIDVDTNTARQIAIEAAQVSRYIYLNKPISVLFFNEVKERRSYLKMRLKAYVSDIRYEFTFQSDMTEIVMKEFLNQGIVNKEDLM